MQKFFNRQESFNIFKIYFYTHTYVITLIYTSTGSIFVIYFFLFTHLYIYLKSSRRYSIFSMLLFRKNYFYSHVFVKRIYFSII